MESTIIYIFNCSAQTYAECLKKQLFGAPNSQSWVNQVKPGDICLLHNFTTHDLSGVWEAITSGQRGIDPNAWKGQYPNQVKVKQRSEQLQSVPKDLVRGLATDKNDKFINVLKGEAAQKVLTLFTTANDTEVLPGIPLRQEEADYRNKYPAEFLCSDGHRVRSLSEKTIDDWLAHRRIFHSYEPLVYVEDATEQLIPDFCLYDEDNNSVFIEFWGREGDAAYEKRMKRKQAIYEKHGFSLIQLRSADLQTLDNFMLKKLRDFKIHSRDWLK